MFVPHPRTAARETEKRDAGEMAAGRRRRWSGWRTCLGASTGLSCFLRRRHREERVCASVVCVCPDNTAARGGDEAPPNSQAKERERHGILANGEICVLPWARVVMYQSDTSKQPLQPVLAGATAARCAPEPRLRLQLCRRRAFHQALATAAVSGREQLRRFDAPA